MSSLLVTGAAGLVGAEVVGLLQELGHSCIAVTHRNSTLVRNSGAIIDTVAFADGISSVGFDNQTLTRVLSGNVREPGFGFSAEVEQTLAGSVSMIIHSAATTDFAADEKDYEELNVAGAIHACELAMRWDVPLVYVSTAYVCGSRNGHIGEDDFSDHDGFSNGYEHSKFRAESYIRNKAGLRWSIVRPGIVTGDSATGVIRDRKNLYTVVKLIVEGKLRTLPGRYDATVALAPIDFVAKTIVEVVANWIAEKGAGVEGKAFHAVGAAPISLRTMSEIFAEYPSFEVARFVPRASFVADELPSPEREYYGRIGVQYVNYFGGRRSFDSANVEQLLGISRPVTGPDYLRLLLDDCLAAGFLGTPLIGIEEAVQCLN